MHPSLQLTTAINPISRPGLQRGLLLIPFIFACCVLSPAAHAVDPPPDGGYPNFNTAEGDSALFSLTTGASNTAIGYNALFSNAEGSGNTATGVNSLFSNTTGNANTANGVQALFSNTTGTQNTANGAFALPFNTTGSNNTATGFGALEYNTTGYNNTATGLRTLSVNSGHDNTADGIIALYSNTTGGNNVANGSQALHNNGSGSNNTAIGSNALFNNQTGAFNIALGNRAGFNLTTGSENIAIGNPGLDGDSNTIRIGKAGTHTATYVAGINGATVPTGVGVVVDSKGHLGTVVSSERFKDAIKPMDEASEAIFYLRPVTFRYKHELDPKNIPQFGLVAEKVAKVNPDLVAYDDQGKPYTVRYEAVNAMLLNEFLKEHQTVQNQAETIEGLKAALAKQQEAIKALTATVDKVSARMEADRTAQLVSQVR